MRKLTFGVFTVVYMATAAATLIAFLAQSRIIPSGLGPNEDIPHLGVLISAVLVETVGGYVALARNLFGLQHSESQSSEAEQEIKTLAVTSMKVLNRLQALAYRYSLDFQKVVYRLEFSSWRSAESIWLGDCI